MSHFHCSTSNAPDGIWTHPLAGQSTGHNICVEGRQVPDVYILGAAKCATTALAYELIAAGSQCAGDIKEYNFFKKKHLRYFAKDTKSGMDSWLQGMPACDAPHRVLLGDYSPENLQMTDGPGRPLGLPELPVLLGSMYARYAKNVNFVVMLREPLARTHSWAHYGRTLRGDRFQREQEALLDRFTPDNVEPGHNSVWGSFYGYQMERWLKVFNHSQFYVIPYRAFADGDAKRICHDLRLRFHYRIHCGQEVKPIEMNRGHHTALHVETTHEFRDRFRSFFGEDHLRLLHHLSQGSLRGMGLALYSGDAGDRRAINLWLDRWW